MLAQQHVTKQDIRARNMWWGPKGIGWIMDFLPQPCKKWRRSGMEVDETKKSLEFQGTNNLLMHTWKGTEWCRVAWSTVREDQLQSINKSNGSSLELPQLHDMTDVHYLCSLLGPEIQSIGGFHGFRGFFYSDYISIWKAQNDRDQRDESQLGQLLLSWDKYRQGLYHYLLRDNLLSKLPLWNAWISCTHPKKLGHLHVDFLLLLWNIRHEATWNLHQCAHNERSDESHLVSVDFNSQTKFEDTSAFSSHIIMNSFSTYLLDQ